MPSVFVELLINGIENDGNDMGHDDDPEDYRQIPFKKLYKMFCDEIANWSMPKYDRLFLINENILVCISKEGGSYA